MRKVLLVFLITGIHAFLHGQTRPLPSDWTAPADLRRVRVQSSIASSFVDPGSDNYRPQNAHDGNRRTKWAAADLPSDTTPQWIELDLAREQKIAAVAVFGEAIGNDGILDARIQLAVKSNSFVTVASATNSKSPAWIAEFPPALASKVKLAVTRSSGPGPHTDVYEVEVYGPRLAAADLLKQMEMSMIEGRWINSNLGGPAFSKENATPAWCASAQSALTQVKERWRNVEAGFARWGKLSGGEKEQLADDADRVADELSSSEQATAKMSATFKTRLTALQWAHSIFANATGSVNQMEDKTTIRLFNKSVLLEFDKTDGTWNAFWRGTNDAAIFRAGFQMDANGKPLWTGTGQFAVTDFTDKFGKGKQIEQSTEGRIKVSRKLRIYDKRGAITIAGSIRNGTERSIALGNLSLLSVNAQSHGWWQNGDVLNIPAAVFIAGASELQCSPGRSVAFGQNITQAYSSSQILNLTDAKSEGGITVGFLSAFEARPELHASFTTGNGGQSLTAQAHFLNRQLDPGESIDFDALYLCAEDNACASLENYASAAARFAQEPVRRGSTALWCSWYAHRMAMTEDLVLANAAVAAKHFKPLGFEIIQLDHGWQRGDVTGDWVPNERFPHGLKWLAGELKDRFDLRLGVWIAPTDFAETSETFRQHPDWALKDEQGKPRVNWRWYWKPNPNCYELDASNPDAANWMENVFLRLTSEGVSYYKIDFIAASGGEHFVQQNQKVTRGWSVMRTAMDSIRRGAGTNAWIRYCQPPPLLAAGLANSAYGGGDTLDAGLNGDIHVLRDNARSLAASYWLNDRLYHREVCDMSVRMQADIEEVRMRLALMTLADCSISFSDELQFLPLSRIRMMQQCLPPGNPPMKPLDLFERSIPSIWHIHCTNNVEAWDVVGLFNFENVPETRKVDLTRLGLAKDAEVLAFEFWEQKLKVYRGSMTVTMPPQSSRILALRRVNERPQIVGTDMHLLQGHHELKHTEWDEQSSRLSGEATRAPGLEGNVFVYVPPNYAPHFEFPLNEKSARLTHIEGNLWAHEIHFRNANEPWSIPFDKK
jgi:alpha-galactosidase